MNRAVRSSSDAMAVTAVPRAPDRVNGSVVEPLAGDGGQLAVRAAPSGRYPSAASAADGGRVEPVPGDPGPEPGRRAARVGRWRRPPTWTPRATCRREFGGEAGVDQGGGVDRGEGGRGQLVHVRRWRPAGRAGSSGRLVGRRRRAGRRSGRSPARVTGTGGCWVAMVATVAVTRVDRGRPAGWPGRPPDGPGALGRRGPATRRWVIWTGRTTATRRRWVVGRGLGVDQVGGEASRARRRRRCRRAGCGPGTPRPGTTGTARRPAAGRW